MSYEIILSNELKRSLDSYRKYIKQDLSDFIDKSIEEVFDNHMKLIGKDYTSGYNRGYSDGHKEGVNEGKKQMDDIWKRELIKDGLERLNWK